MRTIYFVRHGETDMNVAGLLSGTSNAQLTAVGKQQASAAGKWARENGIVFDAILASPAERTQDTAKHIAREIDYDMDGILTHHDLRERHFGVVEGEHHTEVPSFAERKQNPFQHGPHRRHRKSYGPAVPC